MESNMDFMLHRFQNSTRHCIHCIVTNLNRTDADHSVAWPAGTYVATQPAMLCSSSRIDERAMLCSSSDAKNMPAVVAQLAMLCSSSRIWSSNCWAHGCVEGQLSKSNLGAKDVSGTQELCNNGVRKPLRRNCTLTTSNPGLRGLGSLGSLA